MAGRPTKYTQETCTLTQEYMDTYKEQGDAIPSAVGLACFLGVSKRTIYVWAEAHKPFLHMLEKLNSMQERTLITGGLDSSFQPTIAKLVLSKHGYHDKVEQDVSLKDYRVVPADESLIDADD